MSVPNKHKRSCYVEQVNGHFMAKTDPLGLDDRKMPIELDPQLYGFSDKDLDRECVCSLGSCAVTLCYTRASVRAFRSCLCICHAARANDLAEHARASRAATATARGAHMFWVCAGFSLAHGT